MLIEKIFLWIKQKTCKHRTRKSYDKVGKRYVYKCTKCGKVR
jgi:hypothetical protein